MKALITTSVIALLAIAGNGYWLNQARIKAQLLEACAEQAWVYACELKAVPIIKEENIVYRQAAILPPPVM
jgi:hypothetical protein